MKFFARSVVILFLLYGLVFAIGDAYLAQHDASIWVAILFPIVVIGLQYAFAPNVISWVMTIHWISLDDPTDKLLWNLPDGTNTFIRRLCADRGLRVPRLGIIQSGTPNAFSFGRTPADARVVITTGLIDVLTVDELNAVVAHEIGHVEHWDFLVMTVAAIVPLLLYQMYVFMRHVKNTRAIAYGAYLAYLASQFIVLALNRTREYFADSYAAEVTHAPDALSSALVKIACGLVRDEGERHHLKEAGQAGEARRAERLSGSLAVMGISNVRSGRALALGGADPATAARVMEWDLVNPWARVYELNSTHPLTALRVRELNSLVAQGALTDGTHRVPRFALPTGGPMRWGLFPLEVVLWAAPAMTALAIGGAWAVEEFLAKIGIHIHLSAAWWSPTLLFLGLTWTARVLYRYRGAATSETIGTLLEDLDVSEMRPRAVTVTGEILGRGLPGAFWSPDLVIKDATGLLFVLYRQSIPFARLLFAINNAEALTGQTVTIHGWYRRGLTPYLEMSTLELADGRRFRAYSRYIQLALAAGCVAIGWMLR